MRTKSIPSEFIALIVYLFIVASWSINFLSVVAGNYIRPYITANFVQTDAQKQLKAGLSDIILVNRAVVAIIYSLKAVFTIAYGLLVHFVSWLAALLIVQWVTCSLLACEVEGLRPGVIFFVTFQFQLSFTSCAQ